MSRSSNPHDVTKLSKRCRRLLEVACRNGRATKKEGDSCFDDLVDWGLLSVDGSPTDKGRSWNIQASAVRRGDA